MGPRLLADSPDAEAVSPVQAQQLFAMLNAGRYPEVEARAHEFTLRHPGSGVAWKLYGVCLAVQGKDALGALKRTAELLPEDAEAHNNLGNALRGLGQFDAAAASCRRALELNPNFAEAHSNLGNALRSLGHMDAALATYHRALELKPDLAEAHNGLGNALMELGKPPEIAAASYRRALELKPRYAEAHSNLSNALLKLDQVEAAVQSARRALEVRPHYAEAHNNLGLALQALGESEEAMVCFQRALELKPEYVEGHLNLGSALLDLARPDAAAGSYRRALELKPQSAEGHTGLSMALRQLGSTNVAETHCRTALEIEPNFPEAISLLAGLRADQGQFAEAERLYQRAISIAPDLPDAWSGIPGVRKMTPSDTTWLAETQRIEAKTVSPRQRAHLLFALGKYFDDVRDFEQAFFHYQRANESTKRYMPTYDPKRVTSATDVLTEFYDREWVEQARSTTNTSARPVFVIGMPRSGTTLAEQILASHPAVFGAGELHFWYHNVSLAHLSPERTLEDLASDYLRLLAELSPEATRVVDKMPANFENLGLIHAALPAARIIHMQRHPIDTCLSIYFQNFAAVHGYSNDLENLAHFYGEYRRVMAHWQAVLPADAILNVPYEGLVADTEGWSRRMLEFIGLPWDPRCLQFHQTQRTVVTASSWQVRQEISQSSVARWRNYERFVEPLYSLVGTGERNR